MVKSGETQRVQQGSRWLPVNAAQSILAVMDEHGLRRRGLPGTLSFIVLTLVSAAAFTGCGSNSQADSDKAPPVEVSSNDAIALLYYTDGSPFNAAFRAGAVESAKEQDVELEWLDVADGESQGAVFDRALQEKFAAICFCPVKPDTQMESLEEATAAKIPVVICERRLTLESPENPNAMAFVATDHAYCGQILAEQATKVTDDDGKLLLIGGEIGVEADRAMNVAYALKDTKMEVVAESDVSTEGIAASLTKFVEENKDVSIAIIAVSAEDARQVLDWKASAAGKESVDIPLFGFGSWEGTKEAIQSGALNAVVLEDPRGMGAAVVLTAVKAIGGGDVGGLVTTGELLVSAENIDDERTVKLLKANLR